MAIFVRQDDNRSELQQRLANELNERNRKKTEEADLPDGVTDSEYVKGTTEGSRLLWLWILVGIAVVILAVYLVIKTS